MTSKKHDDTQVLKERPGSLIPRILKAEIERSLSLTFSRKEHGSFGAYCYLNGGAKLFDQFKSSPNYHPFHGERNLFADHADTIAKTVEDTERAIVIGQGPWESVEAKELKLFDRMPNLKRVDFIDIADEYNKVAVQKLSKHFNEQSRKVHVTSHCVNYLTGEASKAIEPTQHQTTVISTGSTFTNPINASFEGLPKVDLAKSLEAFRDLAGPRNKILLAYDSNNRKQDLTAAYSSDLLEAFYLNGLRFALESCDTIKGIDPEKVEEIFELSRRWYSEICHYAHKLRVRDDADPFQVTIKNEWVDIEDLPISPGDEFTLMSCIKPDPRMISDLGNSRGMVSRFKISGPYENTIHVFKNDFDEQPKPQAA